MIDKTKFDELSSEELDVLGASIGYPDYTDKDDLYNNLNRCWGCDCDVDKYIETVSKLK